MKISIKGGARVIVAIGVVLGGTATYGQYSGRGATKSLTSFCGFKRGEKKQNIRVSKGNNIYPDSVRCRSPFRKFRDARLKFSADDRLVGVEAVTFIQGMKPSDGKAELDKCCSELAKYGITFPDEWRDQGEGRVDKEGNGSGISLIHIQGDLQAIRRDERSSKEIKGVLLTIDLSWGDSDVDAYSPKVGKYIAKNNLSRREFMEKCFGVKFGEAIPDVVRKGSRYNNNRLVIAKSAPSICGMNDLSFYCDSDGKLGSIILGRHITPRNIKGAEPEYGRLCGEVKSWLEIDSFETKDISENFVTKKGATRPMRSGRVSSFEDESIRVEVEISVWSAEFGAERGGERGANLLIKVRLPREARREHDSHKMRGSSGNTETAADVEKRMKAMTLPNCTFRPPAKITDVVEFMCKKSRELDTRNVPDDRRGFHFALRMAPPGKTRTAIAAIPDYSASDISLWRALTELCKIAEPAYKFEVDRWGVIVVEPKAPSSN